MQADRQERQTRLLLIGLALLCCLPFLIAGVPEMVDSPNHVARIHILAEGVGNTDLMRYFAINWRWMGNLGVDLPALLLAPLIGVEAAVTLIAALIAPLTIFGLYRLSHAAHGRFTGMAGLALPLVLSQTFLWGFLNYNLSIALVLIVSAEWLRNPPEGWGRALLFAVVAIVLWTVHTMGWGLLLLTIAGFELARCGLDWRLILKRLPLALPLFLPLVPMAFWRSKGAAALAHYDPGFVANKIMNFATVLRGTSKPFDLAMTAAIVLIALYAMWRARKLEPKTATAGVVLLLSTIALPTSMMDSWASDLRVLPLAMMVALVSVRTVAGTRLDRGVLIAGAVMLLARLVMICAAWHAADVVHTPQLALLDKAPLGGRIAYATIRSGCGTPWPLRSERHLGSYAMTRRDAFTNTTFEVLGADLVTVRDPRYSRMWTDGSQDLATVECPSGKPAPEQLATTLSQMSADFDAIWIVSADGTPLDGLPPVPGMHLAGRVPGSLMLVH